MSSYALTILGSDIVGLSVAKKLTEENNPEHLALVGSAPTQKQIKNLISIKDQAPEAFVERFPESLAQSDDLKGTIRSVASHLNTNLGSFGNRIVDLEVDNAGFSFLLQNSDGDLTTIHSRHLLVTAPPLLDFVDGALNLPGSDSAVTGLIIDRTGLGLEFSRKTWNLGPDESQLWDFDFGFECEPNGKTSNMRIFTSGQCAAGPTTSDDLAALIEQIGSVGEPYEFQPDSFDPTGWQDAEMPEGFVDTKIARIGELLSALIENNENINYDQLSQELEGIAGEVDSYSRFRTDPELQRLRWKTLTAMNFARPYFSNTTVNA